LGCSSDEEVSSTEEKSSDIESDVEEGNINYGEVLD